MELLRREYEGNEESLRSYIQKILAMSQNYLRMEPSQIGFVGPGIPVASNAANAVCVSNLTVIAPEAPESRAFREKFCRTLRDASTSDIQVVTNPMRRQEVTLINITNVFPARFVSVVSFLREAYLSRIKEGRRASQELHSEGCNGKLAAGQEFPDLYPDTYKPEDIRPWLMIAEAMGLIQVDTDTATGLSKVYLVTRDEDGLNDMEELGTSIERVIETADVRVFEALQSIVEPLLQAEYLHVLKRQDLILSIRRKVEEVGKFHKANDPVFIASRNGFMKAKEILNLEEQSVGA